GRQGGNRSFGSSGATIAGTAKEAHRCCGEAFDRATAISAARDEYIRHELRFAFRERRDDVDDRRGVRTERFDLRAITAGAREADGFDFGAFCRTGLADIFRFAGGFSDAGIRVVLLDVDTDLGARKVGLHVSSTLGLLHLNALILSGLLLLERFDFLVGNFAMREHRDHVLRENNILDVNAFGLDLILLELLANVIECFDLHLLARLDEFDGFHVLQRIAEMVADRGLENLVYQVFHGANHGDNARRFRVRHVNLDLQVDLEDEAFLRLRGD